MKQRLVLGLAALIAFSCSNNDAVIEAQINGANGKEVIISKLDVNQVKVIDTIKTKSNGTFKYGVNIEDKSPNFYYLSYNRRRLASLILKPGDKVKVNVDTLGNGLEIKGSDESVLLAKYDSDFTKAFDKLEVLAVDLKEAIEMKDAVKEKDLRQKMGKIYVQHRQSVLKNIIANPKSFANVSALYQAFTPDLAVFSQATDIIYMKGVYDSLQPLYPNSTYIKIMAEQISKTENYLKLNNKINSAKESPFPNISLPDINSKKVDLNQLEGKPFMLVFWSATDVKQKMFNNDLKDLYSKYNPKGFEIYQVGVDIDKALWATAVREQELPWIAVCDGLGANSSVLPLFNVKKIPMLYIFNKKGDIIAKDIYSKAQLDAAIAKSLK